MDFRTVLSPSSSKIQVNLGDSFVTIGSCFANSIDQNLKENKFSSLNNPVGILFDPASIARVLMYALDGSRPTENSYCSINEAVVNLETHSDTNGKTKEEVEGIIDGQLSQLSKALRNTKWLIITFGTSWIYTHISRKLQVANCHKIPQKEFEKSLLTHQSTEPLYDDLIKKLRKFNPELQIIVTVSPVRHVKDTLPLNNLSKSHLLILSHYLNSTYNHVHYYPSYELVLDDLRDYRFYKTDMLHPTEQAIDYVWDHFTQSYFSKEALNFLDQWEAIKKALQHKPFDPFSQSHQRFVKSTIELLKKISPKVDTKEELEALTRQLIV
ncbi:MAG: GSCFA domain-containing protein [Cyclobacteriaceae bacterium]|nr:GSCFA domain-containing protein [Cyclobacteriaceae bacterium]